MRLFPSPGHHSFSFWNWSYLLTAGFLLFGCTEGTDPAGNDPEPTTAALIPYRYSPVLVSSPARYPLSAPPARGEARLVKEVEEVKQARRSADAGKDSAAEWWNDGACLRWNALARDLVKKHKVSPPLASRAYALLSVAQYDAILIAGHNKSRYKKESPGQVEPSIKSLFAAEEGGAYPSEHAAIASASAAVLAYVFPQEASLLEARAREHRESRLHAGVSFRSDIEGGDSLGRLVGALAVERGKGDGHDGKWEGTMPAGPGYWYSSMKPAAPGLLPAWGKAKAWLMAPADSAKYMPPPPPAYDSPRFERDLEEVRRFSDKRTPEQLRIAQYWADGVGTATPPGHWNEIACDLIQKEKLSELKAARILAHMNMAVMDAGICCWAAKYKYCLIRPSQMDTNITTPVGLPNFPAYTSGHSSFSGAASDVLAYFFPARKDSLRSMAQEAAMSRLYGGIHYRFDSEVGLENGRSMASLAIGRLRRED